VTVDKLLRAKEEGAYEAVITSIACRFWAHQVAKKTGCDKVSLLNLYYTGERMMAVLEGAQMELEGRLGPFSWQ
jgi:hypothetical protein